MARRPRPIDSVLDLPVSYGDISIGDKTARVGIVIDRSQISISQADMHLVGKRLIGKLYAAPSDEDRNADQARLDGMEGDPVEMSGAFDVKRIGVTAKNISAGLTFMLASIDIRTLGAFAKRIGRVVIDAIEEIPEGSNSDEE